MSRAQHCLTSGARRVALHAALACARARGLAAALLLAAAPVAVQAQDAPAAVAEGVRTGEAGVVVELFTSQGCVACPPADALMARLADRPGVIALSLHVDIWDYLGWVDRFADPAFTDRQKAYARAEGSRSIYTPQMIVAGTHRVNGSRGMELADLLQAEAQLPRQVHLEVERKGDMLEVRVAADPPLARSLNVDLVRYTPRATVQIGAGENAGRTVTHHNIVTLWETLGLWDGNGPVAFHVRIDGADPIVVIVQEPGPGAILAASRTR
jgi:hypothetical protein